MRGQGAGWLAAGTVGRKDVVWGPHQRGRTRQSSRDTLLDSKVPTELLLCPYESRTGLPLVLPQSHIRGQRPVLVRVDLFCAICSSKVFSSTVACFQLRVVQKLHHSYKELAPNRQSESDKEELGFGVFRPAISMTWGQRSPTQCPHRWLLA